MKTIKLLAFTLCLILGSQAFAQESDGPPEKKMREQQFYDVAQFLDTADFESYFKTQNYIMEADSLLYWVLQVKLGNISADDADADPTNEIQSLAQTIAVNDTLPSGADLYSVNDFSIFSLFQLDFTAQNAVNITSNSGNVNLNAPNGKIRTTAEVEFATGFILPDGKVVKDSNDLGSSTGGTTYFAGPGISISGDTIYNTLDTSGGASTNYTGASPATVSLGGFTAGDAVSGTYSEILEQLLVPYVAPSFTSFTVSGQSTTLEVGSTISGNFLFSWAFDQPGNITASTTDIYDVTASTYIATNISNSSPASAAIGTITKNTATSHSWRGEATNTQSSTFNSSNFTINWRWKRYFGFTNSNPATNADIIALSSDFTTNNNKTYTTAAPTGSQYLVFAFPASFGALSSITVNGFPSIASFTLVTTNVTNANGQVESYRIYYSNNTFSSSATVSYD